MKSFITSGPKVINIFMLRLTEHEINPAYKCYKAFKHLLAGKIHHLHA